LLGLMMLRRQYKGLCIECVAILLPNGRFNASSDVYQDISSSFRPIYEPRYERYAADDFDQPEQAEEAAFLAAKRHIDVRVP
jgi:hypothetical protein